uniref:Uncharacterized protein n=1 Tax=uncultured marine virus TaxID=186617 RepID=A0A0F7L879_9VIRU|nr:hypothetical protein [uncultured marine virus]
MLKAVLHSTRVMSEWMERRGLFARRTTTGISRSGQRTATGRTLAAVLGLLIGRVLLRKQSIFSSPKTRQTGAVSRLLVERPKGV